MNAILSSAFLNVENAGNGFFFLRTFSFLTGKNEKKLLFFNSHNVYKMLLGVEGGNIINKFFA